LGRALREGESTRWFDLFAGESAAFLAACRCSAGVISVPFLAVDPLEQDIQQEVTPKNGKRQKYGKGHRDLTRTGVNRQRGQGKTRGGKARKS
jgi:hypothetical protein